MPFTRRLAAIVLASAGLAASGATAQDSPPLVPDCNSLAPTTSDQPDYARLICAQPARLESVNEIASRGDALAAMLPVGWRTAFMAQQAAFPQFVNSCPTEPHALDACVDDTLALRLEDIANLAAGYDTDTPPCSADVLTVSDSGQGDAGMSKLTRAYFIAYTGTASCRLLGYPAITAADSTGTVDWTAVEYSSHTYYVDLSGPPLPITLSPAHPKAWFAISTASACDPASGTPGYTVTVAPPLSGQTITTLTFENATCDTIAISPIAMPSMLGAAIY